MNFTAQQQITANNKFSKKLTFKRKQNKDLAAQIFDYFKDLGLRLPSSKHNFKHQYEKFLVNRETGEYFEQHYELANAYYQLRQSNKAVYALFKKGQAVKQQILACWYSKHRLDHVWLYRKSRLIRKMWRQFLNETELYKEYTPKHLVLTVPHKGGQWAGKNFYARELIQAFNLLRKSPKWKKAIYAGEYGVEISKSPESKNGLHIHLHCLVFQRKGIKAKAVHDMIREEWQKITGAERIHYETLYIHKKDESGKWITEEKPATEYFTDTDLDGVEFSPARQYRKKFYLNEAWFEELPESEKKETYVVGILEAIKYHFKNDTLLNADGSYNIELISEVLENSKYLRMYSKFGGFYGEKRLNYSQIEKDEEPENEPLQLTEEEQYEMMLEMYKNGILPADEEREIIPPDDSWQDGPPEDFSRIIDLEFAEKSLVNPFTKERAGRSEYERYLALPEKMFHQPNYKTVANAPIHQGEMHYFKINPALTLGQIMKYIAMGHYNELFEYEEYERFNLYMYQFNLN